MPFTDVDDYDGRRSSGCTQSGITGGCAPTLFCPNARVTRAQMAMFLDRALDLPAATTDYFDDDDGRTGEASINALAKAAITGGCRPAPLLPVGLRHARPDGDVPGPRPGACPTPRPTTSTTTTGGPARAASTPWPRPPSPVAAAARRYCPSRAVDARADGRLPVPRPPAGPPRLNSAATARGAATLARVRYRDRPDTQGRVLRWCAGH